MAVWLTNLAIALYFFSLGALAIYGLHRLWLLLHWLPERNRPDSEAPLLPYDSMLPHVTVQLPVYNEQYVVHRLLNAAAQLDWPADRLEIQVLDDSTDQTSTIIDERCRFWQDKGVNVNVVRRTNRQGYKAGALAEGLKQAKGEYIAIFDADFVPPADFLRKTIGHFQRADIGMVQTQWTFINSDHSWITRIQKILLTPHFRIEHLVRSRLRLFFNFNGTAGVWRKDAIVTSGGWQSDTVTEDLDLSYRAQLAGWRFIYLDGVTVPSELPITLSAFRNQQQRWAKGSLQTACKLLPRLWRSAQPLQVKVEAGFHLLANSCWLLATIIILTIYPVIISRVDIGPYQLMRFDLPLFFGASIALLLFFMVHLLASRNYSSLWYLPAIPPLCIGLAPSLALAVLQGLFQRGGVFERTPKYGVTSAKQRPINSYFYAKNNPLHLLINLLLFSYGLMPVLFSTHQGIWLAVPFTALFPAGALLLLLFDVNDQLRQKARMVSA